MGEEPADAGVVCIAGGEDAVGFVDGGFHPLFCVFGEVGTALVVAVDVLPGLGGCERELIGAEADNGTVAVVEALDDLVEVAALEGKDVGDAGDGPEFWAGKTGEGVDVEVVDCIYEEVLVMIRCRSIPLGSFTA